MGPQNAGFRLRTRVTDGQAHHEPVELGFRQRIGPLVLDGVLRGDHHEGNPQVVGLGIDGHLVFLHALQQCRLCLRAGPIDLVPQDDVREDGPGLELEVPPFLVVDVHARDVGGQ